mmetsp:Transcript_22258/g.69739  ORF Transcript_22258/g.69739 Transcript_22258/m.69739 type:complete len:255 (+) Transcript_22258:1270-2034(+)
MCRRGAVAALLCVFTARAALRPPRRLTAVALRLAGGAELEPEAKSGLLLGGGASFKDQLVHVVKSALRFAKRLVGLGDAEDEGDTAPAPKKKAPPAKAKRRAPQRLTAKQRMEIRIARELEDFIDSPPDGCRVSVGKNMNVWIVTMTGADETIFEGEKYKLRVQFPANYPTSPPSCYFLEPTPRHPHVYTNGDICLDLLGKGWRPNLTIAQLSLSILSMLSSAKTKGIPIDNSVHAASSPGKAQEGWMYHDDSC